MTVKGYSRKFGNSLLRGEFIGRDAAERTLRASFFIGYRKGLRAFSIRAPNYPCVSHNHVIELSDGTASSH